MDGSELYFSLFFIAFSSFPRGRLFVRFLGSVNFLVVFELAPDLSC
jgi:hypothetical protein